MGNNPETWAILISILSLALAGVAFARTNRFREDLIQLQLPLLDFWTEVERENDEWVITWSLQNKGSTAAELTGWTIFVDGKPVDLPIDRRDWATIFDQLGVDSEGGWFTFLSPGFPMNAQQNVKVLEVRCPIPSGQHRYVERDRVEEALSRLNIKCQYISPGVDFEDETYLR